MDIIFFRENKKLSDSFRRFSELVGPPAAETQLYLSAPKYPSLLLFQVENTQQHPHCISKEIHTSFLRFSLVEDKNAPYSTAGALCHGSRPLASWGNLVCHLHSSFGPHTLWSPPRVPMGRYFCGHASHRKCGVCVRPPLQWAPHSQGLRRRCSVSSWYSQCAKNLGGSLTKRLISLFWVVRVPQSMRGGEGITRWSWFSCSKAQA